MNRMSSRGFLIFFTMLIASCGGGGDGGPAAPTGLTYGSIPAYTINKAITPLTPTVVGQVTNYSVTPALPAGLSLATSTGVISGTPTALAALAAYTVTASNVSGSTTASVSIAVNDVSPTLAYQSSTYAFSANVAAQAIQPTTSGGAVVTWSAKPALPAGLTLDVAHGTISGTPTTATAAAPYVVTAANSGGNSQVTLTIAVGAAPLMDLGHSSGVLLIRYASGDVLSLDANGHWLLQNYTSGATLASGDNACSPLPDCYNGDGTIAEIAVDLAGNTVIDGVLGGLEVRSASNGQVLGTISGTFSWFQLASDGSYVTTGSATGLAAYSPAGKMLFSLAGDYSQAIAFSSPTAIQVALSPAGQNVIQTIPVATGVAAVSAAFQGTFSAWFVDGARFLTTLGASVWTYSSAGVQQDVTQVAELANYTNPTLVGQGGYFWWLNDSNSTLNVYQVGNSASPSLTAKPGVLAVAIPSGTTIGVLPYGAGQLSVIDLSGATPIMSAPYSVPVPLLTGYAAATAADWVVGNTNGVIFDGASIGGTPRFFAQGTAWSISGGTNYFSVATAAGSVFNFAADTDAPIGSLSYSSSQLSSSSAGSVLAALPGIIDYQFGPTEPLTIYSLPSGGVLNSFSVPQLSPRSISLSSSGTVLAEVGQTQPCYNEVLQVAGGTPIWCDSSNTFTRVVLSPDGTLIAATINSAYPTIGQDTTTSIFKNGTLVTSVPGLAAGWIDNGRLLVDTLKSDAYALNIDFGPSVLYSPLGVSLGNAPLPPLDTFDVVGSDSVYAPSAVYAKSATNEIFSLTTGAVIWASGNASTGVGAVSGSQVVFASGTYVLAQPQ